MGRTDRESWQSLRESGGVRLITRAIMVIRPARESIPGLIPTKSVETDWRLPDEAEQLPIDRYGLRRSRDAREILTAS
jgi:hypothetical protein